MAIEVMVKKKAKPKRETQRAPKKVTAPYFAFGLLLICAFYVVLKSFSLNAYAGDEHIYTYQAKMIAEGTPPYSSFAMAHPPLHGIVTGLVIQVFGYDFKLTRALPMLWCLFGGLLLAFMIRRELGAVAAVTGTALYLLAYEPLRASSHATGVNMTVALLIAAFFAYRLGAMRTTAIICVAAVFTRLYAIPGVMALCVFALIANRRSGIRLILWGVGAGTLAFVAVGIWAGFGDMIHNIVRYHAQKVGMKPETLANMKNTVLFHNSSLFTLFILSQVALLFVVSREFSRNKKKKGFWVKLAASIGDTNTSLVLLSSGVAVFFLVVLINMDRVWMYYFIPSFPFAAVSVGWLISRWTHGVARWFNPAEESGPAPMRIGGVLLFIVFAVAFVLSPRLESNLSYWDKEMKKSKAQRTRTYTWNPGALPEPISLAVKLTLWSEKRTVGEIYTRFNYLLWHESRIFDVADEIVSLIDEETSSTGRIFGDSGTVPLFALLSKRDIGGNEIDTNIQRYKSGNADPRELIERIDSPTTEMIILRKNFGVFGVKEVQRLIREKYRFRARFVSAQKRIFLVFKRGERKPPDSTGGQS